VNLPRILEHKTKDTPNVENGKPNDGEILPAGMAMMAFQTQEAEMKGILEEESRSKEAAFSEDGGGSTWHTVVRYRRAVLWSSFIGMAGINWGMDVLVSTTKIPSPSFPALTLS
jgi:hypothetical protein